MLLRISAFTKFINFPKKFVRYRFLYFSYLLLFWHTKINRMEKINNQKTSEKAKKQTRKNKQTNKQKQKNKKTKQRRKQRKILAKRAL